jgi:DNA-binding response OmpR family regulator
MVSGHRTLQHIVDLECRGDLVRGGLVMEMKFAGRCILVVEDQPLIVLDIGNALRKAGASLLTAANLQEGLRLAEHPQLSAAILDFGLGAQDSAPLCVLLSQRRVPYVIYTGYDEVPVECRNGVIVQKPAATDALLDALAQLLGE